LIVAAAAVVIALGAAVAAYIIHGHGGSGPAARGSSAADRRAADRVLRELQRQRISGVKEASCLKADPHFLGFHCTAATGKGSLTCDVDPIDLRQEAAIFGSTKPAAVTCDTTEHYNASQRLTALLARNAIATINGSQSNLAAFDGLSSNGSFPLCFISRLRDGKILSRKIEVNLSVSQSSKSVSLGAIISPTGMISVQPGAAEPEIDKVVPAGACQVRSDGHLTLRPLQAPYYVQYALEEPTGPISFSGISADSHRQTMHNSTELTTFNGSVFSIDHPKAWIMDTNELQRPGYVDTTIRDPADPEHTYLRVDYTPNTTASLYAAANGQRDPTRPGYRQFGFDRTTFDGRAAIRWEFEDDQTGSNGKAVLVHKIDMFMIDSSHTGWAVLVQAPASRYTHMLPTFSSVLESFSVGTTTDGFETPSKNIRCDLYDQAGEPTTIRCTVFSVSAQKQWVLSVTGQVSFSQLQESDFGPTGILGYGEKWTRFGVTCSSESVGLSCKNRDGHGFFLSRQRQRVF
jgi:hypothetical protein